MTAPRRLLILATIGMTLAACAAPASLSSPSPALGAGASSVPSEEPTAGPSAAAPTTVPQPTLASPMVPAASPGPTAPECPSDTALDYGLASLHDESWSHSPGLEITSIRDVDDGSALPRPAEPHRSLVPMYLYAASNSRLAVTYDDWNWPRNITITSVSASLTIDNQPTIELETRIRTGEYGENVVVVRVPEIEGRGTFEIALEWRDACFEVAARASGRVIVEPRSSVDGCPTARDAGFDELSAAFAPPIRVGTLDAALIPWLFTGNLAPLWVIDPLPPYVSFTRTSPTMTAAPGATVQIATPDPGVELRVIDGVEVDAFRRAPLSRWLEGGWIHGEEPEAPVVFQSTLREHDDGTFSFTVPSEPGRYALQAIFEYDAACTYGVAGFVVGIDVGEPASPSPSPSPET